MCGALGTGGHGAGLRQRRALGACGGRTGLGRQTLDACGCRARLGGTLGTFSARSHGARLRRGLAAYWCGARLSGTLRVCRCRAGLGGTLGTHRALRAHGARGHRFGLRRGLGAHMCRAGLRRALSVHSVRRLGAGLC